MHCSAASVPLKAFKVSLPQARADHRKQSDGAQLSNNRQDAVVRVERECFNDGRVLAAIKG